MVLWHACALHFCAVKSVGKALHRQSHTSRHRAGVTASAAHRRHVVVDAGGGGDYTPAGAQQDGEPLSQLARYGIGKQQRRIISTGRTAPAWRDGV